MYIYLYIVQLFKLANACLNVNVMMKNVLKLAKDCESGDKHDKW